MPARYDSYDGADDAARREQHRLPARELAAPPYTQPARYRPPSTVTQDERATLGPDDSASQLESSHGGRSYQGPRATSSYDPYAPHVPQQRPVSYSSGRQDSQSVEYYGHSERDGPFSRAPELEEYRDGRHELGEAYGASSSALPLVSGAAAPAGHRDSRYDYEHDGIEGQGYYDPPGEGKVHYSDGPEAEDDRDAIKADEETVTYPPVSTKGLHQERQAQEPSNWRHLFYDSRPIASRIHDHQRGIGVQKYGIACYVLAVVMSCVMIWELVRMNQQTGSPIQTRPIFNVMIGPSAVSLINDGARFSGCMKFIPGVSDISWVCVNSSNSATVTAAAASCTMADICGFSGFPPAAPNQSFRFVLPIFLHAGVIHLALNMLVMCLLSAAIERQMGTPRFLLLFIPAGIFGFVLGGNFALVGQPSVGASGAIFATEGALLVDLIAHWPIQYRPKRRLLFLGLEVIVGLALGLIPGIDNFSHIGGFAMGLLIATLLLPVIHQTRRHRLTFVVLRCLALPITIVLFVVLVRNFYTTDSQAACSWCRYLSCWPTAANNRCQGTGLSSVTSSSSF